MHIFSIGSSLDRNTHHVIIQIANMFPWQKASAQLKSGL